jgi:hypothetical protein
MQTVHGGFRLHVEPATLTPVSENGRNIQAQP